MSRLIVYEPRAKSRLQRIRQTLRAFWRPLSFLEPPPWGGGPATDAGVNVTLESALCCSAVFDAVNQISSDIGKLPLITYKRRPNGGRERDTSSRLFTLLRYEPNPEMDTLTFRRQLTAWALTSRGGFAEIQRNNLGQPIALWPIEPYRVRREREETYDRRGTKRLGPIRYNVDNGTYIAAENMIDIKGLGASPHAPYSLIDKARTAIALSLAAERFGAAFFENGSTFGGILTTELPNIGEEERKTIKRLVEEIHRGPDRAHRLAFLPGGIKYTQLGIAPQDSQMHELRSQQIEEVARFFRIPPHRLGLNKPGTVSYASVEMANLDYYTGCLLDWITAWELELTRKLIPSSDRATVYVEHLVDMLLRGDAESRGAFYGALFAVGAITPNEIRTRENLDPIEGGDRAYRPLNMAEIGAPAPAPPAPDVDGLMRDVGFPRRAVDVVHRKCERCGRPGAGYAVGGDVLCDEHLRLAEGAAVAELRHRRAQMGG